ncbi:MAG TPA: hypothetical protein VEJ23_07235 [Solirubrobacteraceae bacterium]|nr:hypothetical protein [Solirubrobacteraceae bacterium]
MTPKWIERQIDEALLLVATQAAFLYVHRRARRLLPKVAAGALVLTGLGAAAATVAAGVGAVGAASGAVAWYRYRSRRNGDVTPAWDTNWRPDTSGATPATTMGSKSVDAPA